MTVIAVAVGQRRERRGVKLAVQAVALIVEGVDQIAAILDADCDAPPALAFKLRLQGLARLPVAQRRVAERVAPDRRSSCRPASRARTTRAATRMETVLSLSAPKAIA